MVAFSENNSEEAARQSVFFAKLPPGCHEKKTINELALKIINLTLKTEKAYPTTTIVSSVASCNRWHKLLTVKDLCGGASDNSKCIVRYHALPPAEAAGVS